MSNDQSERDRALRYSRTREWLALIDLAFGVAIMLLTLITGFSARLRSLVERVVPRRVGTVMPFVAASMALSSLLSLPLSFYRSYIVEHRYGLSNQTVRGWVGDSLKGAAVGMALAAPLAQGAYWVMGRFPRRWWAVLSALVVPFSVLLTTLAPVLLLPLFNTFEPLRNRRLEKRLRDLAEAQGVRISRVMRMDMSKQTKKANAFFTGIGATKRIVLADTLLDEFTHDEVEVVLAHELGHQVHRDLWKLIGLQPLLTAGGLYAMQRFAPPLIERFGRRWGVRTEQGVRDPASLPLLGLVGTGVMIAVTPIVNAIVRAWVEHPADAYALELTRKTGPFISAIEKLGRMNLADPDPPALIKWVFHNHPTVRERVRFARQFAARNGLR